MAQRTSYHPGGFDPAKPQQNRSELFDGTAGTYTAWDTAGAQTATRALTAQETADLAAQDVAATAETNTATIRQQAAAALANLRTIRDAPQVSVTSLAQAQTVCRQLQSAVQSEATVLIKLGRLLLGQTDGLD